MDGALPVSPRDLYARPGTTAAPVLIDVRRRDAFGADDRMIGASHRSPDEVERWLKELPPGALYTWCRQQVEAATKAA